MQARARLPESGTLLATDARRCRQGLASEPGASPPCRWTGLRRGVAWLGLVLASVSGCAFWDEVTSKEFTFKSLFVKPEPLKVLEESKDGDHRQAALRRLQEPKAHGGTDKEQDKVVAILCTAANTEQHPICRLAAIQVLGNFKDKRVVDGIDPAVGGLAKAYYNASRFHNAQGSIVNQQTAHVLKCAALQSLGQTGNPAALKVLVSVLRQPPTDPDTGHINVEHSLNERVTAARPWAGSTSTRPPRPSSSCCNRTRTPASATGLTSRSARPPARTCHPTARSGPTISTTPRAEVPRTRKGLSRRSSTCSCRRPPGRARLLPSQARNSEQGESGASAPGETRRIQG